MHIDKPTKTPTSMPTKMNNFFIYFLPYELRTEVENWYERKIGKKITEKGIVITDEEWLAMWNETIKDKFSDSTILSQERKTEIIRVWPHDIAKAIGKRREALQKLAERWDGYSEEVITEKLIEPAWCSVGSTSSGVNHRLQVGLKNIGCTYWRKSKFRLGCLNCGYYFGTVPEKFTVTDRDLILQFKIALEKVMKDVQRGIEPAFDVIEILNDGSFLNDKEISKIVRTIIFRIINEDEKIEGKIKRVLVESRPEYITRGKILDLLKILNNDQELEIAIGLESSDDFVSTFCIHKGFGRKEVEEAVRRIKSINEDASIDEKYKYRCKFLFYVLVKPAYLTESEALEDAVNTVKYVHDLGYKYDIETSAKLEPTVVPAGTILEVLYLEENNQGMRRYFPPSYWTILEILARLDCEGINHITRIGAREDMDRFLEIPAAYQKSGPMKGMLSQWDFILYEAVQEFNKHHDFKSLLVDIEDGLCNDRSLNDWKEEVGIREYRLLECYEKDKEQITYRKNARIHYFNSKEEFLRNLFSVLDLIEYGNDFQDLAKKYCENNKSKENLNKIKEKISFLFKRNLGIDEVKIEDHAVLRDELRLLRMQLRINVDYKYYNNSLSIWIGIPTTKKISLEGG